MSHRPYDYVEPLLPLGEAIVAPSVNTPTSFFGDLFGNIKDAIIGVKDISRAWDDPTPTQQRLVLQQQQQSNAMSTTKIALVGGAAVLGLWLLTRK